MTPTTQIGFSACPICQEVELRGLQTACSPACRRKRSREQRAATLIAQADRLEVWCQQIAEEIQALRKAVERAR